MAKVNGNRALKGIVIKSSKTSTELFTKPKNSFSFHQHRLKESDKFKSGRYYLKILKIKSVREGKMCFCGHKNNLALLPMVAK